MKTRKAVKRNDADLSGDHRARLLCAKKFVILKKKSFVEYKCLYFACVSPILFYLDLHLIHSNRQILLLD